MSAQWLFYVHFIFCTVSKLRLKITHRDVFFTRCSLCKLLIKANYMVVKSGPKKRGFFNILKFITEKKKKKKSSHEYILFFSTNTNPPPALLKGTILKKCQSVDDWCIDVFSCHHGPATHPEGLSVTLCAALHALIIVNWQQPNLQGFSNTQVTDHCLQEQPRPKGLVW